MRRALVAIALALVAVGLASADRVVIWLNATSGTWDVDGDTVVVQKDNALGWTQSPAAPGTIDLDRTGAADDVPPSTPSVVSVVATGEDLRVTVTQSVDPPPPSNPVTHYIERSVEGGTWALAASTTGTVIDDGPYADDTDVSYRVYARDALGNQSGTSAEVAGTSNDTVAPSTPGGLVVTDVTAVTITVTWNAVTDPSGVQYQTRHSIDGGGWIEGSWQSPVSEVIGSLPGDTDIDIQVRARDGATPANESAWSSTVEQRTDPYPAPPDPPGTLTLTATSTSVIQASWGSVDPTADGHMVRVLTAMVEDSLAAYATQSITGYGATAITKGVGTTPVSVTSAGDSGAGTLRQILEVDGVDDIIITFDATAFPGPTDTVFVNTPLEPNIQNWTLDGGGTVTLTVHPDVVSDCDSFAATGSWPSGAQDCGVLRLDGANVPGASFMCLIRGLRIVQGSTDRTYNADQHSTADGLQITGGAGDVAISQCEFGPAGDDAVGLGAYEWVTIQYSVIADNVKGLAVDPGIDHARLSIHHCLFTNNGERSPYVGGDWHPELGTGKLDFSYNVIHGVYNRGTVLFDECTANVYRNWWVPGDSTDNRLSSAGSYPEQLRLYGGSTLGQLPLLQPSQLFVEGNVYPVEEYTIPPIPGTQPDFAFYQDFRHVPWPIEASVADPSEWPGIAVEVTPWDDVPTQVLAHAGVRALASDSVRVVRALAATQALGALRTEGSFGYEYTSPVFRWVPTPTTVDYLTGLPPNTGYTLDVRACRDCRDVDARSGDPTSASARFTLAALPSLAVENEGTTQLDLVINHASNPGYTEVRIQEVTETAGHYLQADGTLSAASAWLTLSSLGTRTIVTGLSSDTSYGFQVVARNEEGVSTATSATASGRTLATTNAWYIDPVLGNDTTNDGEAPTRAWKTWGKALDAGTVVAPGDTVYQLPGVFTVTASDGINPTNFVAGAARSQPTVLKSLTPREAVVDLATVSGVWLRLVTADHNFEIDGFTFRNGKWNTSRGIVTVDGSTGITVKNCAYERTDGDADSLAMFFYAFGDGTGDANAHTVENNVGVGIARTAVYLAGVDSCVVRNNHFARGRSLPAIPDGAGKDGVLMAAVNGDTSDDNLFQGNIFKDFRHGLSANGKRNRHLFERWYALRDDCVFDYNYGFNPTIQAEENVYRYCLCDPGPEGDDGFEIRADRDTVEYCTVFKAPEQAIILGTPAFVTDSPVARYNLFSGAADQLVYFATNDSLLTPTLDYNAYWDDAVNADLFYAFTTGGGGTRTFRTWTEHVAETVWDQNSWFWNPYLSPALSPRCGSPFLGGLGDGTTPGAWQVPWCPPAGRLSYSKGKGR